MSIVVVLLTLCPFSLTGSSSSSSGSRVPMFVATIPNVTVTEGRDASLPCIVKDIGDYQVSPAYSPFLLGDSFLTPLKVSKASDAFLRV